MYAVGWGRSAIGRTIADDGRAGSDTRGDEAGMTVASPYATGGGGVTFERRVAVKYLTAMLSGGALDEVGDGGRVAEVRFQQVPRPVDDLHVIAEVDEEPSRTVELRVAARTDPKFVPSDMKTVELWGRLMDASEEPVPANVTRRLAVCCAGRSASAREVHKLAHIARETGTEEAFWAAAGPNGNESKK